MTGDTGGPRRPLSEGLGFDEPRVSGEGKDRPERGPRRGTLLVALSAAMIVVALGVSLYGFFGRSEDPGADSRRRVAIDAVTGEVFESLAIRDGDSQPWANPRSGTRTLYPAESCHWAPGGGAKLEPTWVLLNRYTGKAGPTVCPDCGREVVPHNPTPPPAMMSEAARAMKRGG